MRERPRLLSVVIPLYNEEALAPLLIERTLSALRPMADAVELVLVDDGSRDETAAVVGEIARNHDKEVKLIVLSRNFGKEIALTAGLDHAAGDVVVFMDGDLQHPPEVVARFLEKWREGFDMVYGVRRSRNDEPPVLRWLKRSFYRAFNRVSESPLPAEAGDFRLLDRHAADALRRFREKARFMKGLYALLGFRSVGVPYEVAPRAAGRSSWNPWRLWNFALTGLTGHSTLALRIWGYIGFLVALAAMIYAVVLVLDTLLYGRDVPGYASTVVLILVFGSLQMISMGVLGEYVARLYQEVKQRPLYIVGWSVNLDDE